MGRTRVECDYDRFKELEEKEQVLADLNSVFGIIKEDACKKSITSNDRIIFNRDKFLNILNINENILIDILDDETFKYYKKEYDRDLTPFEAFMRLIIE